MRRVLAGYGLADVAVTFVVVNWFGVAGHIQWTDQDRTQVDAVGASVGDVTYWAWTADVSLKGDGWNAFVAGYGGYTDYDDLTGNVTTGRASSESYTDYGVIVQGGIFIPETDFEFFLRYDATFIDQDERNQTGDSNDIFNTITGGVNWYYAGHAAKFTADVIYFIDDIDILSGPNTLVGYLGSTNDGELTIQFQFQLLF